MITLTAFKWVPLMAQGLVRDLRVRWALEEAGLPYEVRLIDTDDQKSAAYRAMQPFGQVPVLEDKGLVLFESGAIVLHIAGKSDILMPRDDAGRARVAQNVIAALNSIEPFVQELAVIDLFHPEEAWAKERRPQAEAFLRSRLDDLETWLDDKQYLDGGFTAGDIMMTHVLRILRHTDLLDSYPKLKAYKERCEARPAFQRALKGQLDAFEAHAPDRQAA
ncbi:glutathione S-transferase family protein [Arvimicrobium flavum]|uniref:glutathione S-transferase family protein n=1 Tax=Arvimicrobium flavum TaxID=3393320 RepID=UPI00237C2259|nr:glutathione S-transferase family protein [Mesorhizobium shangrilense]